MRLTRRDALAALAATGAAAGGAVVLWGGSGDGDSDGDGDRPLAEADVTALVAAAEALYPSAVENVGAFVAPYVRGRAADRPDHARGIAGAVAYLDGYARSWYDRRFAALDTRTRGEALRAMGADTADPDPDGSDVERVRYYVVDELLYGLYASPTGGELAGTGNPVGHPGGLASYQRGPD